MSLTELKQRDMKLLSRKRVTLLMDNEGATPSRKELVKKIAARYKVNEDLVVIKHIYSQFGKTKAKLIVNIYENKEKRDMFEHKNLLKKHAAAKEEAPKGEPKKEQAPKEETPEAAEAVPEQAAEPAEEKEPESEEPQKEEAPEPEEGEDS